MPTSSSVFEDRAVSVWSKHKPLDREAQRALLSASEDLTVCCLTSLARLHASGNPHAKLLAQNHRLRIEVAELQSQLELLRGRIQSTPPRERPHYSPAARFEILQHMRRFLLSVEETARRFLVTPQTLYDWLAELNRHPERQTVGSLLDPVPPVRRYADVVRRLARQMKAFAFGGDRQIAAALAAIGWKPSRRAVQRFGKEREDRPAPPPRPTPTSPGRTTTVSGRYPNHLWLIDITRVPTVFPFFQLHLAVVLDACSRLPLAAGLSLLEPSAAAMAALFLKAVAQHAKPRHLVSDQGPQFTAEVFRETVRSLGVRQRFGKVGETHSLGLIDRFFRTIKDSLRPRWLRPWNLADCETRLRAALVHYSYCRPHSSLAHRTPIEIHFGIPDQRPLRNLAPRGRPGDPEVDCPVDIGFLDPDAETLPILVPKAA